MDILQSIGILDIIFIVLLTISILLGLIRGVIREVLSLAGLIASVYLAFTFSDMIANKYVSKFLEDPSISYIVTFVLIIIATLFAVTLVNLFFSQLLKASGLSVLNRILGAIFGVLRGALICSILVMVISFIPGVTAQNWWKNSSLVPVFSQLSKSAIKLAVLLMKLQFHYHHNQQLQQLTLQLTTITITIAFLTNKYKQYNNLLLNLLTIVTTQAKRHKLGY